MIRLVDFETNGLLRPGDDWATQPGITQVAVLKLDEDWNEIGSFVSYVNPEMQVWDESAIKTTGITPETVADAPTFFALFPAFARFMHGGVVWTGYNTSFDRNVLRHMLNRYGFAINMPWPPNEIDVMHAATRQIDAQGKRGSKIWKLEEVYKEVMGAEMENAHDALADCRATAAVGRKVARDVTRALLTAYA